MKASITGLIACEAIQALAVLFIVFAQHGSGEIDRQHDVVALGARLPLVLDLLGTREAADQQGEPQGGEHRGDAGRGGERRTVPGGGKRHEQDGHPAAAAQPEGPGQGEERQEPERIHHPPMVGD